MEKNSIGGEQYFIIFINNRSRYSVEYYMWQKSEALDYIKQFKAMAEKQTDHQ